MKSPMANETSPFFSFSPPLSLSKRAATSFSFARAAFLSPSPSSSFVGAELGDPEMSQPPPGELMATERVREQPETSTHIVIEKHLLLLFLKRPLGRGKKNSTSTSTAFFNDSPQKSKNKTKQATPPPAPPLITPAATSPSMRRERDPPPATFPHRATGSSRGCLRPDMEGSLNIRCSRPPHTARPHRGRWRLHRGSNKRGAGA